MMNGLILAIGASLFPYVRQSLNFERDARARWEDDGGPPFDDERRSPWSAQSNAAQHASPTPTK